MKMLLICHAEILKKDARKWESYRSKWQNGETERCPPGSGMLVHLCRGWPTFTHVHATNSQYFQQLIHWFKSTFSTVSITVIDNNTSSGGATFAVTNIIKCLVSVGMFAVQEYFSLCLIKSLWPLYLAELYMLKTFWQAQTCWGCISTCNEIKPNWISKMYWWGKRLSIW